MKKGLRTKAYYDYIITVLGGMVIIALITGWSGHRILSHQFKERSMNEIARTGELLMPLLEDPDNLAETASLIQKQLGRQLLIVNREGEVLFGDSLALGNSIIEDVLAGVSFFSMQETEEGTMQAFTGLALANNGVVGAVFSAQTADPLQQQLAGLYWMIFLLLGTVAFLAWFALVRSGGLILQAVEQTGAGVYDLAEGKEPNWPPADENEEMGRLIHAIHYSEALRKNKEGRTSEEYGRLDRVINSLEDGVVLINRKNRMVYANRAAGELLGTLQTDLLGEPVLEVIKDYDLSRSIQEVIGGHGPTTYTIRILLPSHKVLEARIIHFAHETDDEPAVLMILQDISEIQKLTYMRSEFVANVSHELRTPLTSIKGFAETILDSGTDDQNMVRRFVEIIENEADRLTRLIDDLLDLSRIESGKIRLDFKRTSIKKLIYDTMEKLAPQLDKVEIDMELAVPDSIPLILADPDRIAQVLINYVDNSVKYTHKGGRIDIRAYETDQDIMVEVSDNGVGIPAQDLDRVFERFYRVDKARSRTSGGTGLGLAIVKHIVEAHGGKVFVQSTPGQGSTFGFSLPKGD